MLCFRPRRIAFFVSLILFITVLFCPSTEGAQAAADRTKDVDKLFSVWDKPDSPGCALGVIQNGRLIYKSGYGMANLEYGIPLSSRSVFRIGSTSKQFTAMCILLLEEEGKLSLDDTLKKHFPEMPDYAASITLRHLIHHTSGIRDYLILMRLAGAREDDFYTDPEVVDLLARQEELNFFPGEEFLYSNSGYFLLAQVVGRVTGKSMRYYAEDKIFKPLGMNSTHFHDDHTQIVANRASGYTRGRRGGFQISMTTLDMIGDGGVFTTVDDLLLWDLNFYANRLGKGGPELIEKILTPGVLNSGEKTGYACGLGISEYKGLWMISHSGAFVGFRAEMIRFPELKFSVVVLANLAIINPSLLARRVADLYLADEYRIPERKKETASQPDSVTLSREELEAKAGDFYDKATGNFLKITLKGDRLQVSSDGLNFFIQPVSQTKFLSLNTPVETIFEFANQEKDQPLRLSVRQGENRASYEKVRLETLSEEQMMAFAGDYFSEELDVTYRVVFKEGRLHMMHKNPHRPYPGGPLVPKMKDMYTVQGLLLRFERNERGAIFSLSVDAGRVKNIRFVKKLGT